MRLTALFVFALGTSHLLLAAAGDQTIVLEQKLQVPGTTLSPGTYTFTVEDRLPDRAIVKITNQQSNEYQFVLTVPTQGLQPQDGKLVLFPSSAGDKQILQAWKCGDCQAPLQAVYAKDEAVAITQETAKSVMAVDPSYDKLPQNLSADDRKVVTLWLLSPKEITSDQKGKGVEAAKYVSPASTANVQSASAAQPTAPAATAAPEANVASGMNSNDRVTSKRHMPHTASNTFTYALAGLMLLFSGLGLRLQRRLSRVGAGDSCV